MLTEGVNTSEAITGLPVRFTRRGAKIPYRQFGYLRGVVVNAEKEVTGLMVTLRGAAAPTEVPFATFHTDMVQPRPHRRRERS